MINAETYKTDLALEGEVFKKIVEVDGGYVSNFGNCISVTKRKTTQGYKLREYKIKPTIYKKKSKHNNTTMFRVMFDRRKTQGKAFYLFLDKLVAKYFIESKGGHGRLLHKDGDKLNCHYKNIMYMYDYEGVADDHTLRWYKSNLTTPLGIASYEYIKGNKLLIASELNALSTIMSIRVGRFFKLSDDEGRECFWEASSRLMQMLYTGVLIPREGQLCNPEGLLWWMTKSKAKTMGYTKSASVSITSDDKSEGLLDKINYNKTSCFFNDDELEYDLD